MCYSTNQAYIDYSTSQILQMIGRAGRPQFDKSATAVIMTKIEDKVTAYLNKLK
jgi:replicative superfamily II helicase